MHEMMAEGRTAFISDKIQSADSALTFDHRLCLVANELLASEYVSLALVVDHVYSPVAATDNLGALLDEEQFAVGNGPTYDAQLSPAPLILADVHAHRAAVRWPIFTKIAEMHGVAGAFAFPLRVGYAYLGVLTAYRSRPGEPSAEQYADGLILASLATAELVRREAGIGSEPGTFEPPLHHQSSLQIAAGMVAESLNISIVAALARIRARAFADGNPVHHTAQQIVARHLVLEQ